MMRLLCSIGIVTSVWQFLQRVVLNNGIIDYCLSLVKIALTNASMPCGPLAASFLWTVVLSLNSKTALMISRRLSNSIPAPIKT